MVRVGIVGSTGYTGMELVRILSQHPEAELTVLTSESYVGRPYVDIYPALRGMIDLRCEALDISQMARQCDVVFTALPHTKAMECVSGFLDGGCRVVDLSADFRLRQREDFEAWYGPHQAPELLSQAAYGLPELHRDEIRDARLVANPGCYPTGALLAAAPLLAEGWVDPDTLIVNSASGVTGAGRSLSLGSLFCEVNDGFRAYKVAEHRHTPEMEQEISRLCGRPVRITFVPHLIPASRGILTTLYATLEREANEEEMLGTYRQYYSGEPFVRILPAGTAPNVRDVRGTNLCDIGLRVDRRTNRVVVLSVIDNLVKGASGQAVQNMNLLFGLPETLGLEAPPLFI